MTGGETLEPSVIFQKNKIFWSNFMSTYAKYMHSMFHNIPYLSYHLHIIHKFMNVFIILWQMIESIWKTTPDHTHPNRRKNHKPIHYNQ